MKIFVSYSHVQRDWVYDRLEPCLKAGGADVLIYRQRFVAGPNVVGQMDETQDKADRHVLVLSTEYLQSPMCQHEMGRAIKLDSTFARQLVVPVRRDDASLPDGIRLAHSLHVDLRDDSSGDQWDMLLKACRAPLGVSAPIWLAARDEVLSLLQQDQSTNLVVKGSVRWKGLIEDLATRPSLMLKQVDLNDPATVPRRGLITAMLSALGAPGRVPQPPDDLPELGRVLGTLGRSRLAIEHFDIVRHRRGYDVNLFAALRFAVMDKRQLVLLIQSQRPFSALLPRDHPLSQIDLKTVEL